MCLDSATPSAQSLLSSTFQPLPLAFPALMENIPTLARLQVMSNAGHAPFWDGACSFNQRVRSFYENP
jgi:pimeloyl-ACP methyl ester carboxylesterase